MVYLINMKFPKLAIYPFMVITLINSIPLANNNFNSHAHNLYTSYHPYIKFYYLYGTIVYKNTINPYKSYNISFIFNINAISKFKFLVSYFIKSYSTV